MTTPHSLRTAGNAAGSATATADAKPAVIELSGPASASPASATLQLVLRNAGETPLWVNQRLLINTDHAPAEAREVWFDVVSADGRKLAFEEKIRAGAAEAKNYRILEKGQSKQLSIELSRYFKFDKPGLYEITAHYQDGNPKPPKSPNGSSHLDIALRSAPIKVQIQ